MSTTFKPEKDLPGNNGEDHLEMYNQQKIEGLAYYYDLYYDEVESFLYGKAPWCGDIDIIVNDSFKKTWKLGETFETAEKLLAYVKKVAYHSLIDYLRRRKREGRRFRDFINYLKGQQTSVFSEDAEVDYDLQEIRQLVIETLDQIPGDIEKKMVKGALLDGLSNKQLAEKYDISSNLVRTYKSRGLKRFRPVFLFIWRKKFGL